MKTVHDLDEDEFLAKFNRDTFLEDIFGDARMERDGIEILVDTDKTVHKRYRIAVESQSPLKAEKMVTYTLALLIGVGYFSHDEASQAMELSIDNLQINISRLRKLLGKSRIHTRLTKISQWADRDQNGGYYIGDIGQHRLKYVKSWNAYKINAKTGFFAITSVGGILLNTTDTKIIQQIVINQGRLNLRDFVDKSFPLSDHYSQEHFYVKRAQLDKKICDDLGLSRRLLYVENGQCMLREFQ